MEKNICCFAGHSKLKDKEAIINIVFEQCYDLAYEYGVREFWVGNYGDFDKLAAKAVSLLKELYSDIQLNLVVPYLTKEINNHREQYDKDYDNIIIASLPMGTPNRYKIIYSNKYMVDNSKYIIAYVESRFGGAAKTLEYARGKNDRDNNIQIFNFAGYC